MSGIDGWMGRRPGFFWSRDRLRVREPDHGQEICIIISKSHEEVGLVLGGVGEHRKLAVAL